MYGLTANYCSDTNAAVFPWDHSVSLFYVRTCQKEKA
jgi:hypothetical protein